MQFTGVISFIISAPVMAQFIATPVAFDTADLFVPPTGAQVFTFGSTAGAAPTDNLQLQPSTVQLNSEQFTSSVSVSTSAFASPATVSDLSSVATFETSASNPSIIVTLGSVTLPSSARSDTLTSIESSEWGRSSAADVKATWNAGEDVVTVLNTFYTTVSCSTTTTEPSIEEPLKDVTLPAATSISSTSITFTVKPSASSSQPTLTNTHDHASVVSPVPRTSSSAYATPVESIVSATTTAFETSPVCSSEAASTRYATTVLHTTVTQWTTSLFTETAFITVSV